MTTPQGSITSLKFHLVMLPGTGRSGRLAVSKLPECPVQVAQIQSQVLRCPLAASVSLLGLSMFNSEHRSSTGPMGPTMGPMMGMGMSMGPMMGMGMGPMLRVER